MKFNKYHFPTTANIKVYDSSNTQIALTSNHTSMTSDIYTVN